MIMRIIRAAAIIIVVLFTVDSVLADDCENLNEQKICWDSSATTTLSWTNPQITSGEYLIEVRDFNWLGSSSIRVTKNGIIKEGVLSEGEYYSFDFSNNSNFNGIKIIADQISNINSFPSNIGTFPSDPQAAISFKISIPDENKKPTLEISISAERENDIDSKITANIIIQNPGDSDLLETQVRIIHEGLEVMNEFDFKDHPMNEVTASGFLIKWENVSSYKLTPTNPGIIKNGYFIKVINFSNKTAMINTSYNGSIKSDVLLEGGSIIFGYTRENEYMGIKILGAHISNDAAELILQVPVKNSLKRRYPIILAGNGESIKLGFKIPGSSRKTYTISAIASAKDREGNNYIKSASTTISLQNTFNLKKITSNSILGENLYSGYSRVRDIGALKNITYITISVVNLQNYPVHNVKLRDTISPDFNFIDGLNRTSMSWDFDINAGDHKEFSYAITAKRQGIFNLPKAELTWDEWGETLRLESNVSRTSVSGPYIVMERSFNKSNINIGDTLLVSLSLTNNGDIPTNIFVNDSIPQNTTFISGTLSFSGFLRPRENARIVYAIIVNDNIIEFKAPEMISKNQGFEWYKPLASEKSSGFYSEPAAIPTIIPVVSVKVPEQVPEPAKGIVQMVNEEFPWLGDAISIITLLSGILLLLLLNKKKYFRTYEK
ncbi:MAG: DUF11 domain-containing protein [Candidatus Methanoperedens sp.]|nr:DUF11 domain-containing protein [Candidatus Methanoperedens sp.]CAG0999948.1 hypothetical protein METP1_02814 [Methanosarcinales archaeon]